MIKKFIEYISENKGTNDTIHYFSIMFKKLYEELEKSNKDIDNFVSSYEHMKYTKKQFEYLTLDIINSLSPQQKSNYNLLSSNSFTNFNLNEK